MRPLSGLVRRRFRALHPPKPEMSRADRVRAFELYAETDDTIRRLRARNRFYRCRCGGTIYTHCGRVLGAGVAAAVAVGVVLGAWLAR